MWTGLAESWTVTLRPPTYVLDAIEHVVDEPGEGEAALDVPENGALVVPDVLDGLAAVPAHGCSELVQIGYEKSSRDD